MIYLNELIFLSHCTIVSLLAVLALRFGPLALASLASLYAVLANLFVLKQTTLFGLGVTCTDAYAVGSGLLLNLAQEYFGPRVTKQILSLAITALVVFVILAQFQLWYLPDLQTIPGLLLETHNLSYQQLYQALLTPTPRLLAASLCAFTIAQTLDAYLYRWFQKIYHQCHFILRNYSSLLISQFVDTALFTILGLAGTFSNLWAICWFSYGIKILTILVVIPIVSLSRRWAPRD